MSTAKELFKELGYEKAEKSQSVVLYTNGYGDTISFKETKHVVLIPRDGCGALFMTCLLENAIHKQCKELGWLEKEEIAETNYEHFKDEIIKNCAWALALVDGKPKRCNHTRCSECGFSTGHGCNEKLKEWLRKPYEKPTYKLTQFEFDLLNAHKDSGMQKCISNYRPLLELHEKGYFKDVDTSVPIHKILENCEIKGDEKNV